MTEFVRHGDCGLCGDPASLKTLDGDPRCLGCAFPGEGWRAREQREAIAARTVTFVKGRVVEKWVLPPAELEAEEEAVGTPFASPVPRELGPQRWRCIHENAEGERCPKRKRPHTAYCGEHRARLGWARVVSGGAFESNRRRH